MTIYLDVLHDSILGEKDEPITVINLLHIKANVLKKLFCSMVLFSVGRKMEKKPGRMKCALLVVTTLELKVPLQGGVTPGGPLWVPWDPLPRRPCGAPVAAQSGADRASSSARSGSSPPASGSRHFEMGGKSSRQGLWAEQKF